MPSKLTIKRIESGVYEVTIGLGTYIVKNLNKGFSDKRLWEVFTAKDNSETTMLNSWACFPKTKKQALEFIQEDFDKGLIK